MKHMIGDDWRSLFDIVIVQARKPKFFTQKSRPFRRFNIGSDRMAWQRVSQLEKNQVYMEGTVFELLKITGWQGSQVIYFGDQIFSDLADITLNFGWRTGNIAWFKFSNCKLFLVYFRQVPSLLSWKRKLRHLTHLSFGKLSVLFRHYSSWSTKDMRTTWTGTCLISSPNSAML